MKKIFRYLSLILPIIGWCFFIFYLSSRPVPQAAGAEGFFYFEGIDKIYHIVLYAPLGFFCSRLFSHLKVKFIFASLLCFFYGVSDEIHQFFVLERDFQFSDLFFNLVGGMAGFLVYYFYKKGLASVARI